MKASPITQRMVACADVRHWAWWELPWNLRVYVGVAPTLTIGLICYTATQTSWSTSDLVKFAILLACGMISVAATPKMAYLQPGMTRDFMTAWVLPVAILLPPIYAMVTPIPLIILTQWLVHRGVVYRRVFTAGALGLAYGTASMVFRLIPASFAGGTIGTGRHALTWAVAVGACELVGGRIHRLLISGGIKLTDPSIRITALTFDREALQGDFAEFDLGLIITVVVAVSATLAIFAVPTVLLARRYMMHGALVTQTKMDTKTGLLNAAAWEAEAAAEVDRAVRTNTPMAIALVDIDHFKVVNDTYGHLAGDHVLRALSDALQGQLRNYDLAGRFGGEEFVLLLPHAREDDARNIAERLRTHIADMEIPADGDPDCPVKVRITISVGVAALEGVSRELTDLMAAADAALYYAKGAGRNRTHVISANA